MAATTDTALLKSTVSKAMLETVSTNLHWASSGPVLEQIAPLE